MVVERAPAATPSAGVKKRRPKDRKAQIASASAEAFSEVGYHAVGMADIAARVGISASALYRHYPNKYALFKETVLDLGSQLVDATAIDAAIKGPTERIDALLDGIIATSIANRKSGGLYRWEGRYLNAIDQAALREQINQVNRRLREPLTELRPELDHAEVLLLSSSALSIVGSITEHHAKLPNGQIAELLRSTCWSVLQSDLPRGSSRSVAAAESAIPDTFKHEVLLRAATILFHQRGYRETTMEEIAADANLPASGVYRYFQSKSDLLAAIFRRAADRVSAAISSTLASTAKPDDALKILIELYVTGAFHDSEVTYVYFAERGNLAQGDQVVLRNIQRLNVEQWAALLVSVRPTLSPIEARFLVHAAMGLVVDLGRLVRFDSNEESLARVRQLTEVTLFGH